MLVVNKVELLIRIGTDLLRSMRIPSKRNPSFANWRTKGSLHRVVRLIAVDKDMKVRITEGTKEKCSLLLRITRKMTRIPRPKEMMLLRRGDTARARRGLWRLIGMVIVAWMLERPYEQSIDAS